MIEAHYVIRNEEEFIERSIRSVVDFVDKVRIYEDNSTDGTVGIIYRLMAEYSNIEIAHNTTRLKVSAMRQVLLESSNAEWIIIVDGDEVWDEEHIKHFLELPNKYPKIIAFAVTFVQHMPFGIARHGSKPVKLFKKTPTLKWSQRFPNETLYDELGKVKLWGIRTRPDVKLERGLFFHHYSGVKKFQWRQKQPLKFNNNQGDYE